MKQNAKALSEHTVITRTREDLELLAMCMAAAIDEQFMQEPQTSRDVIGISVTGSMNGFKSGFIDSFALGVLPDSIHQHYLSFYKDPYYDGQFSTLSGPSHVHGRRPVVLSYMESGPQTFWERFDQPGIHFDQNIPPAECENAWAEVQIRAPLPERPEERAEIFSPQANEEAPELKQLRTMFAYAEDKNLRRAGVLRAFKNAVKAEADMPRMFTLRILDERLQNNARFGHFINLLQDIKKSPNSVSELIQSAYNDLMRTLPSARQTRPADPFIEDLDEFFVWAHAEAPDFHRQIAYEEIEGLSESELAYMSKEGQQRVSDLKRWKAYSKEKAQSPKRAEPNVPPTVPEKALERQPEKLLRPISPKVIAAGLLHYDLSNQKIHLLDDRAKKEYAAHAHDTDISFYAFTKTADLSNEECLLLQALQENMGEPVSRAVLLEEMYKNHADLTLDSVNQVLYGLRQKITDLGRQVGVRGEAYISTSRGKGFVLEDPFTRDNGPDPEFENFDP